MKSEESRVCREGNEVKNSNEGILYKKSFDFAVRIVRLYKYLIENKKEYVLSKQLLRSGTSVGANIKEARGAQSKKDFIMKLHIALKEAGETEYWIELLLATNYLDDEKAKSMLTDVREIIKILTSAIMTTKERIKS